MKRVNQHPAFPQEFEWWYQFKKGNTRAFITLFNWYSPFLFAFGTKYTKETELVKNAVRAIFLELWQTREGLLSDAGMKARLLGSLHQRIHRTLEAGGTGDNAGLFSVEFRVEESREPVKATRDVVGELKGLLDQLPRPQQEVVYLKFFQELSCDEISQVTNQTVQTVAELLQSAIRYLRLQWKVVFSPSSPNIEKLLWNEFFRKWVLKPTQESDSFWHCWRLSNPERTADLKLARAVVLALKVHDRQLPAPEQHLLITQTLAQVEVPAQPAPSLLSLFRWQPTSGFTFAALCAALPKYFRKNKASLS